MYLENNVNNLKCAINTKPYVVGNNSTIMYHFKEGRIVTIPFALLSQN